MKSTLSLALLLTLAARFAVAEEPATPPAIPADVAPPVTTTSGLVYSVLKAGPDGRKPKPGDVVIVHYTGYLPGDPVKVFDSSRKRNQPLEMPVGGFIAGWNEALQLMTPGSRWKLTIPPALAYGKGGSPPEIPPDATLVFDMELLGVKRVPVFEFRAGTPAKQTSNAKGVKLEVVTAGEGRNATDDDVVEVAYAVWNTKGKKIASSSPQGAHIKGVPGDVTLPFFKDAILQMNVGSRVRLEVPPELFDPAKVRSPDLPPGSTSVWEFELVDLKPAPAVPTFELSAPGKATKTASGLEIETIVEGTGKTPKKRDSVTVHYAGWLKKNGTLFDSSYRRGEPAAFGVDQVIPGWTEALLTMKEGGKARLTIPAALAYGPMGSGDKIGPNEDLVFLVELIKVGR